MVGLACIAWLAGSLGCGTEATVPTEDGAFADDSAEVRAAPAFADERSAKTKTIDGIRASVLQSPSALKNGAYASMQDAAGGGYAFEGITARVSPADAAALVAAPARLATFVDHLRRYPTNLVADPMETLTRGDVFGTFDEWGNGTDAAGLAAYRKSSRIAVASFLSKPTKVIFSTEFCPDWCDSAVVAVTTDSEIRVLWVYGDQ